MRILLASTNAKKFAELTDLLAPLGVELVRPQDVGGLPVVDEDRPTFEGNAEKKARSGAAASGLWTLADDSGLVVDALGGAPGVHSARFAGDAEQDPRGADERNNEKLLRELEGRPEAERGAHFVCVLALARDATGEVRNFRGEAHGRILTSARGENGFGYDPLFQFDEPGHPESGRSFAELTAAEKGQVGHRGRALAQLARHLAALR